MTFPLSFLFVRYYFTRNVVYFPVWVDVILCLRQVRTWMGVWVTLTTTTFTLHCFPSRYLLTLQCHCYDLYPEMLCLLLRTISMFVLIHTKRKLPTSSV